MLSFGLGFGAIDSCDSGSRTPPQVQILPELGNDGLSGPLLWSSLTLVDLSVGRTFAVVVVDHCGVYRLRREPLWDLCRTSVGSILVPPCIWRDLCGLPVDVSSSQTACRAARTCCVAVVDHCGPLWDLCGTSVGFPMMYSSSQTVCGTSGRAVAAWLLLEPCEPLCMWRDLFGLPVDVSSSQTVCGTSGRAVAS